MATTARLDLTIWRNDFDYEFLLRIEGPDLTGVQMGAQIRLAGDTPGDPQVNLALVTNGNAEGVRLAGVSLEGGVYVNDVRIRINKSTRQALPYFGEQGDAAVLAWAMVIAGRTRIVGSVILPAHVYESDIAPTNRPIGTSSNSSSYPSAGATLTIAGEDVTVVRIDGAEYLLLAQAAADRAEAAAASTAPITTRSIAIDAIESVEPEPINWFTGFTNGKKMFSDGTIADDEAFVLSNYIPIGPDQPLILNKPLGTVAEAAIVWFNKNEGRIGAISSAPAGGTAYISTAASTAFARFCVLKPHHIGLQVSIGQATAAPYRFPGGLTIADEKRVRDLFYGLLGARRGENIFDETRVGGGAQRIDGTINESNTDFRTSIPIAVLPGGKISLWHLGEPFGLPEFGHVFLDLGQNPVGAIPFPAVPGVYDVPANAFSIRVTMPQSHLGDFVLTPDESNPQGYIPPTVLLKKLARPWFNVPLGIIGDSITNAGYWIQPLLKLLGARLGFKSGVDGRQLMNAFSENPDLTQIGGLIVFLGTNDWFYSRALGSVDDTSAAPTFAGDIRRFFETVAATRKDLRVIWLTSIQRMGGDDTGAGVAGGTRGRNSLGHSLEDYVDIGTRIVGQYGHPVIDLYRQSGANEFTLPTGTANGNDRVHPNEITAPLWISAPVAHAMSQIGPLV